MRYLNVFCLGLTVLTLASCSKSDDTEKLGNWMRKADFKGAGAKDAVSFVIGDTAYVGTGWGISDVNSGVPVALSNFYKYDPVKDNWEAIATLSDPANPDNDLSRSAAVAFTGVAADGKTKGYITTGINTNQQYRNDTWEYDPELNSWRSRAAFTGTARYYAVAFSLKGKGFVGTGYGSGGYESSFYMYDPVSDTWSPRNSLKDKRQKAVAFTIGDSAFVVTGLGTDGANATRMYVYRFDEDQWYEKRQIINYSDDSYDDDYTSIARSSAVVFVMNGKAYVTTGSVQNTWEYEPTNDTWTEKTSFDATARTGAVGFSVRNRGFVAIGATGSSYLEDTREFDPSAENVTND